jgi:trimeric autotransporter adhesin
VDHFLPSAAAEIFNFISTRDREFLARIPLLRSYSNKTLLNKERKYKSDEIINSVKKHSNTSHPLGGCLFLACTNGASSGSRRERAISGSNNGEGVGVLASRTTGIWNTGTGFEALNHLTSGNQNTATGLRALFSDINGGFNTATGVYSLYSNTSGFFNSATGAYSLTTNTTGLNNTANGYSALYRNTTGSDNTAVGFAAGFNQTSGSNNIYIGDAGIAGESNVIAIGAAASSGTPYAFTYIGGIYDSIVDDRPVYVRSDGALGTLVSSQRYKEEIEPMGKASEALFALKPVTFRYRQDPSHKLAFGLIAEEVAEISADLVSRDKDGKPQTVRYEAVNAMLLNEFLKAHRKVEEQEATISQLKNEFQTAAAQQQNEIQALTAQLKEHAAQIQKVSAQLEINKPTPKVVRNNP